ncbi:unnamed protein product [Malus baccata var. baccata]
MAGYYQVPVGYRFMPRDDELLLGYLRPKLDGQDYPKGIVHDCDLYGLEEPSDIWKRLNRASHDGQECTDGKDIYVFTTLNSKAPNGSRVCRTVGTTCGTWKGEDAGKKIYASGIKHPIGFKKRYTYRNKGSSQNDHWIMHEFHLDPSLLRNKHHQLTLKLCSLIKIRIGIYINKSKRDSQMQEKNIVLCILRRKDDISKKRKLEERDNYEENAANHFQPQALNALTVEDYNNAPSYMEQNAFDHFQPQALTATTTGDYINDTRYTEENAANHFQPQEHYAATTGDYRFLVIAIADVLSHISGEASTCISPKSFNTNLNHIAWEVAIAALTYSASSVDNATLCCLTEAQENIPEPNVNAYPEMAKSVTLGAFGFSFEPANTIVDTKHTHKTPSPEFDQNLSSEAMLNSDELLYESVCPERLQIIEEEEEEIAAAVGIASTKTGLIWHATVGTTGGTWKGEGAGKKIYASRKENAANHFQPQEHYAATTGDYSNAHWYTEQNAANHFEPHDEAHNATNEDLTTALRRMEEILMSGF